MNNPYKKQKWDLVTNNIVRLKWSTIYDSIFKNILLININRIKLNIITTSESIGSSVYIFIRNKLLETEKG